MRNILLIILSVAVFASCTKKDDTRPTSSYAQGVSGMGYKYNKGLLFRVSRNGVVDSGYIIFHTNGTVTEVSGKFDSSSYTFPDSLTYTLNTSYDGSIVWQNIPSGNVFCMYPTYDTSTYGKHFILHEYLRDEVVIATKAGSFNYTALQFTPTKADSTAAMWGAIFY